MLDSLTWLIVPGTPARSTYLSEEFACEKMLVAKHQNLSKHCGQLNGDATLFPIGCFQLCPRPAHHHTIRPDLA